MLGTLFLITLPHLSFSSNILIFDGVGGSHLNSLHEVAVLLADHHHNVTLISSVSGALLLYPSHPNIHHVEVAAWQPGEVREMLGGCVAGVIQKHSSHALESIGDDICLDPWRSIFDRAASVLLGHEMLEMLNSVNNFDLMLGEKVESNGMAILGKVTGIPVVNFELSFFIQSSLLNANLPLLLSSQPSLLLSDSFHLPPTFYERLGGLTSNLKVLAFEAMTKEVIQPYLNRFGFSRLDDVKSSIRLYFTNDHIALTFPFLRPPNDIAIGGFNLLSTHDDPPKFPTKVSEFIHESEQKPVVYISFGSLAPSGDSTWVDVIMKDLLSLDARVIMKQKIIDSYNPNNVLLLPWAPQKELLMSGKITLFISHCGNNGRIEATFFNVPLLCVPLFADQPFNAKIVSWKGFGEFILKEDVPNKFKSIVTNMLINHDFYVTNMKRASDIMKREPGTAKETLLFYIEHLVNYGNVDFLINDVIKKQSFVEIHNLDILFLSLVASISALCIVLYGTYKCCFILGNFLKPKFKRY